MTNNNLGTATTLLDCWDTGRQYAAWCTYCHGWHFHAREEGPRAPHCVYRRDELPDGWYSLRLVGDITNDVIAERAEEANRGKRLYTKYVRLGGDQGKVTFAQVWEDAEARDKDKEWGRGRRMEDDVFGLPARTRVEAPDGRAES